MLEEQECQTVADLRIEVQQSWTLCAKDIQATVSTMPTEPLDRAAGLSYIPETSLVSSGSLLLVCFPDLLEIQDSLAQTHHLHLIFFDYLIKIVDGSP